MSRPFVIAIRFLTRLPLALQGEPQPFEIGRSLLFYPLVGLFFGLALVLVGVALGEASAAPLAGLLLVIWVLFSGALHLDGLADSSDAWLGGKDKQRTLEIMKDPRCGPAGVAIVGLVLISKFAALAELVRQADWVVLLLVPVIGRASLLFLFLTTSYVRPEGLGAALAREYPRDLTLWVAVAVAVSVVAIGRQQGLLMLITAGLVFFGLRRLMIDRIGGTTGDTAGALVESTETATLLVAALY